MTRSGDGQRWDPETAFAQSVRRYREEAGMTQAQLSDALRKLGLDYFHPSTISRIEKGDRKVSLTEASLIARLFDQSMQWMAMTRHEVLLSVMRGWKYYLDNLNSLAVHATEAERLRGILDNARQWGLESIDAAEKVAEEADWPEEERQDFLSKCSDYRRLYETTDIEEWIAQHPDGNFYVTPRGHENWPAPSELEGDA